MKILCGVSFHYMFNKQFYFYRINNKLKIKDGYHIRGNKNICMNLIYGLNISAQYGEEEEAWICRGRVNSERKVTKLSKAGAQCNLNDGRV